MIARGFRQVGWVAAVGAAALGCYMVSLNVAASRAQVASLDRQIIQTKRDIRALETELSTRGRLSQLEHWNAEVLALSAPSSKQFLPSELTLARFETRQQPIEQRAKVQLASAEAAPAAQPEHRIAPADYAAAAAAPVLEHPAPIVRRAALVEADEADEADVPEAKPAPVRKAALLSGLSGEIDAAARLERARH